MKYDDAAESDDDLIADARDLRVSSLILSGQELLVLSFPISTLHLEDETPLSKAEAEVAALAVRGMSNAEIAEHRGVAVRTVANQMASILRKLNLGSRRELAVRLVRGDLGRTEH